VVSILSAALFVKTALTRNLSVVGISRIRITDGLFGCHLGLLVTAVFVFRATAGFFRALGQDALLHSRIKKAPGEFREASVFLRSA
jgi:hypothetical protein